MSRRLATLWLVLGFALVPAALTAQVMNVTFLHTPPARAVAGQDIKITGNIVGADQVSIAALAYRVQGSADFEVRELRLVTGDFYEGSIPGDQLKSPGIEYYCYAVDFEGNRHVIFASEQFPQKVQVLKPGEKPGGEGKPGDKKPGKKPDKKPDKKPGKQPDKKPGESPGAAPEGPPAVASDVVAVATRSAQAIERSPAIVSVLSREQLQDMGARSVAEALDVVPGISVARSVSGEYRLAVRGVQSDPGILVMVDGHRINDLYSGSALLEFPIEAVERIEIIRGPGSALYGTGAFMGVVDIITRRAADLHASAAYGRFNELRFSAGGGYEDDAFVVSAQAQFSMGEGSNRQVERDVFTGVVGSNPNVDDISNAPGSVDDGSMLAHAQLLAGLKDVGGGTLELLTHYVYQDRGAYVGKFSSLDRGSDLSLHLLDLDLRYAAPLGSAVRLDTRAYFDTHMVERAFQVIPGEDESTQNSYRLPDGTLLTDGLRETTAYTSLTAGVDVSATWNIIATNALTGGVNFEYLSLPSFSLTRSAGSVTCTSLPIQGFELACGQVADPPSDGQSRMVVGAYLQDHWRDIFKGFDLLAAIRLDWFTDFGLTFNPRLALVYAPIDELSLKLLYSKAFRAPTFQELYEDPSFDPLRSFNGNAELAAVVINTLEFGVEGHIETSPVDYRVRANFFVDWIDDSIEGLDQGYGIPAYDNVESLFVLGTEVEGVARFGRRSRVYLNSSWFRAWVKASGETEESYITDVPQMRLNAGLDLGVLDFLNFHLGVIYGSERRNNLRQRMDVLRSYSLPAYTVVRVGLSTEPVLFDHLAFFAYLYNAFDEDLRDPAPRVDHMTGMLPRDPLTFLVGLAWRP
jgi:outer membrane receptor protein involved in Fe transport